MPITLKGIKIKDRTKFDLTFRIEDNDGYSENVALYAEFNNLAFSAEEEYSFTALQNLRRQLLCKGFDICCNGARVNVYPSPMMMYTSKAYQLTMGRQAKLEDIVDIFDPCELNELATVEEQDQFYQKWIRSLK